MKLQRAIQKALNEIDYFIHEAKENNIKHEIISKLEKGKYFVCKSKSVVTVKDHMAIITNIFNKAF